MQTNTYETRSLTQGEQRGRKGGRLTEGSLRCERDKIDMAGEIMIQTNLQVAKGTP